MMLMGILSKNREQVLLSCLLCLRERKCPHFYYKYIGYFIIGLFINLDLTIIIIYYIIVIFIYYNNSVDNFDM